MKLTKFVSGVQSCLAKWTFRKSW